MTDRPSTLVIGAGIVGCAIARELAVRGVACAVVDDRGIGAGATQASAGMLAPYVEAHEGGPLLDLCLRSLRLYPDWIASVGRESGTDVEFETIGTLEVATTLAEASALREASGRHGRWLEPAEMQAVCPALTSTCGGRFTSEHGYVVPSQLTRALAESALRRGVAFHARHVRRVSRSGDGWRVETDAGALDAHRVVLAAGAWTNRIEGVRTPPIRPVRGQIVRLAWTDPPLPSIVWGPGCYVVPRRDGTILVGATVENAGFEERTTSDGVQGLLDAVRGLLPPAHDAAFVEARVGLRPAAPDDLPVLGDDPAAPGIVHASGHYRNGVLLAPVTAAIIGDLCAGDRRDPCLADFRVDRFVSGEWRMPSAE